MTSYSGARSRSDRAAGRPARASSIAVILAVAGVLCAATPTWGLDVGDVVPDFALTDLDGNEVRLYDFISAGKIVILEHLNVYCHTCREAVPVMNEVSAKYVGERVQMIGVALNNSAEEVRRFRKRFDVGYYVLPDPGKTTLRLFTLENVPTLDIIDTSGTLRYRHVGKLAALEQFDHAIKPLLAGEVIVGVEVGDEAPGFRLRSLEGKEFSLEKLRGSRKVVLAFLSGLSEQEVAQAKILNKIYGRYEAEGLAVLAVASETTPDVLGEFCKANEIQYPVLLDTDGSVAETYRVSVFPQLWVINEAGKVRYRSVAISLKTFDDVLSGKRVVSRFVLSEEEVQYWLRTAMPLATSFQPVVLRAGTVYEARRNGTVIGIVLIVGKDVLCDVCKDVHFVHAVDMEGRIVSLFMVKPVEHCYGQQSIQRFKQQLVGHSITNPLIYGQTIFGLSGSTNSAITIVEGINETHHILDDYKNPNFMVAFRTERCYANMRLVHEAVAKYNEENPDSPMTVLDMEKLGKYLPGGQARRCPLEGTYLLTKFQNQEVILCTFHGVDVERYGITFK